MSATDVPIHSGDDERARAEAGPAPGFGPLLVPKRQAFAAIGVGNTKGHELINRGLLVARKSGSRTLIETESLRRYVAGLPVLQPKAGCAKERAVIRTRLRASAPCAEPLIAQAPTTSRPAR